MTRRRFIKSGFQLYPSVFLGQLALDQKLNSDISLRAMFVKSHHPHLALALDQFSSSLNSLTSGYSKFHILFEGYASNVRKLIHDKKMSDLILPVLLRSREQYSNRPFYWFQNDRHNDFKTDLLKSNLYSFIGSASKIGCPALPCFYMQQPGRVWYSQNEIHSVKDLVGLKAHVPFKLEKVAASLQLNQLETDSKIYEIAKDFMNKKIDLIISEGISVDIGDSLALLKNAPYRYYESSSAYILRYDLLIPPHISSQTLPLGATFFQARNQAESYLKTQLSPLKIDSELRNLGLTKMPESVNQVVKNVISGSIYLS